MVSPYRNYPLVYNSEILKLLGDVASLVSYSFTLVTVLSTFFATFSKHMHLTYMGFNEVNDNLAKLIHVSNSINDNLAYINGNITDLALSQNAFFTDSTFFQDTMTANVSNIAATMDEALVTLDASLDVQLFINSNLTALYQLQETIKEAIDNIDFTKIVTDVIDETGFEVTCPSAESIGFDGALCENDPLGVGPINCDGVEYEEFVCPRAKLLAERLP